MIMHTAGPWRVIDYSSQNKGFIAVVGSSEVPEHICDVFPFGHRPGGVKRELEQHAANAHLIAAAPDLLKTLQEIAAWPAEVAGEHHLVDLARAAIAKASGAST
jgi:hypothetical protein